MPLHWYWSSALPRALLGALPLACLGGALERRVRPLLACLAAYIGAYSLLPHKEVLSCLIRLSHPPHSAPQKDARYLKTECGS